MKKIDPTDMEVMKHAFMAIPEQMGAALQKSAYSPNIKERKDESCALFDMEERMLAQAEHIPVHLGAMPSALSESIKVCEIKPDCQIILNDPYSGGTHLPDVTVIKPVFDDDLLLGYCVNRAHHADIGGRTPGSMPGDSKLLEEEGILIEPQYIVEDGETVDKALDLLRKARSPWERIGDIKAQIGANERGAEELIKTIEKFGFETYKTFTSQMIEYSTKRTRKIIRELPDGRYQAQDTMEWGDGVELNISVEIDQHHISFDFSGTDEQVEGNINAPKPVTYSAVYYVLRCILPEDIPVNEGCYELIDINTPEGTVLNPTPPAAVSAGNVETSQRVVETILKALRPVIEEIPAESQGTMNNLIIGSDDFTYYETIGGGAGASIKGPGESGVHVHMTNTKNTPIEALEHEYPLMVTAYKLKDGSGGSGIHKGGDGIVREIEVREDSELSIQSERRRFSPLGSNGGGKGKKGKNILISGEEKKDLPSMVTRDMKKGEKIRIETPGGGGWGDENR